MATYNYTIDPLIVSQLAIEINDSAISTGLLTDIQSTGSSVDIFFDNTLSAGDVLILDGIAAAHPTAVPDDSGTPPPATGPLDMNSYDINNVGNMSVNPGGLVDGVDVGEPKNSIEVDVGQYQLVNDEDVPGVDKRYGTDGAGIKGWFDAAAGGGGSIAIEDEGIEIEDEASRLNFEGDGVIAESVAPGEVRITVPGDDDLATVQRRSTADVAMSDGVYADVALPSIDVQNDISIIQADPGNSDRILLKETGLYQVTYGARVFFNSDDDTGLFRVRLNDLTVIPGSEQTVASANIGGFSSLDDDEESVSRTFSFEGTAGDFITLQQQANTGAGDILRGGTTMVAVRMKGKRGAPGADGAPGGVGTMIIKEEGTNIPNTPHGAMNFLGGGVTATDGGAGVANIQIDANVEALADIADHALVRGDGGGKGIQEAVEWVLSDDGKLVATTATIGATFCIRNNNPTTGGYVELQNSSGITIAELTKNVDEDGLFRLKSADGATLVWEISGPATAVRTGIPSYEDLVIDDNDIPNRKFVTDYFDGQGEATERLNTWTLDSGDLYYQDFVHGLDTTVISYLLRDYATNSEVRPEMFDVIDADTVRVYVRGNTEDLTINVVTGGATGDDGLQGPQGIQGDPGPAGQGIPAGGISGQVLTKIDATDYNTQWFTLSHDGFADFVTNEHIDHSTVSIIAGAALTGGGDLTSDVTIDVSTKNSIEVDADALQLDGDETSPGADQYYGTNGSGVKGWQPSSNGSVGYIADAESLSTTSRSSSTYSAKLTMVTPALEAGKRYKVSWSFEQRMSQTDNDMEARVQVNNSATLMEHNIEPQDSNSYYSFSGFAYITGYSGAVTIDLDYARESSGTTYMRRARLDIWEV